MIHGLHRGDGTVGLRCFEASAFGAQAGFFGTEKGEEEFLPPQSANSIDELSGTKALPSFGLTVAWVPDKPVASWISH